jgi:hypothetical protein
MDGGVTLPREPIESLYGKELRTLDKGHAFVVLGSEPTRWILRLSTGHLDYISHQALDRAWRQVQSGAELELADLNGLHREEGSYIASILAQLPNVGYRLYPLRMYLNETKCPICGAGMHVAIARRGRQAGQEFLGCDRWPKCRGTRRRTS